MSENPEIPETEAQQQPPQVVEISAAELQDLREKAAKADEYLDLARHVKADFLNYQDRVRRDREEGARQAVAGFLADLLPALDGLSLARFQDPNLTEAVRMLEREFIRVLAKHGVVPIETAGREFNPLLDEAVAAEPGGTKLEEVRRGWMIGNRVLRAASVRIIVGR